ncbi:AlbA family DNA-binding domain-containing protein [Paraburkholderia susongensis]|uniref:Putative DNA-binding domain-containing protein n=1 Tax=Paraburkholderia susongensis TaxID=1515439 RepID=A0A1X7LZK9_9BURK|nr:ATP-binding protein [Paraburkholderia susongensis]SMG58964.1 Putative DNA-binding domain-containing protein [Paraburkholderia susongensis]
MYDSLETVQALNGIVEESLNLEFKAGRALADITPESRGTLVKEVTAFANAAGGTIIYGIGEQVDGERNVAGDLEPVTNGRVTKDQLTAIITSNTDPVFTGFDINVLTVAEGQRIIVINVEQGDTAYQNRLDKKYYQRRGTACEAMYDFAIRDVMNRRKAPRLVAELLIRNQQRQANEHRYRLVPKLRNEGLFTVHHWCLYVDIPTETRLGMQPTQSVVQRPPVRYQQLQYDRFEYSSERLPPATNSLRLLPDQELELTVQSGFPDLDLIVTQDHFRRRLEALEPPLRWSLYVDDAPQKKGETPFEDWCTF